MNKLILMLIIITLTIGVFTVLPNTSHAATEPPDIINTFNLQKQIHTKAEIKRYKNALSKIGKSPLITKSPDYGKLYKREKNFGTAWLDVDKNGCDTRNDILKRDLMSIRYGDKKQCKIISGKLKDAYTGKTIRFTYGKKTSSLIQVDHIVALKDVWLSGGQKWSQQKRIAYANDPFVLIAVSGKENMSKGDGVTKPLWLPKNNAKYICDYIANRIEIKYKYKLYLLGNEENISKEVLSGCIKSRII